ncbi:serine/threonine-protein kinase (plasmid) [Streptomyces sp. BI20]|uniref:serine/threonine-protein kinase n=1 Tax=Streptomyces sp. BI20 TaxID=3403460 RepID=UPI003C743805
MSSFGGHREEPTSWRIEPPNGARGADDGARAADDGAASTADPRTGVFGPPPDADADPSGRVPVPVPGQHTPGDVRGDARGAGRLVGGRYRLLERLGSGGMGTVWRARDEVVDRDVAVKEPRVPEHFSAAERATAHQRMQREARAAARIDHPNVVAIHDVVVEDASPWIVMELVRGRSLGEVLDEGSLDPREAARIGLAVLGALHAAHEAGVLHRDVKPGNVMLGRHERVVLTDFGIAQMEGEAKLTETGAFIGSPEYIAPERVLGRRPGPESDLWSLGVMLYEAVEGVSPFRRQVTPATLQAILLAELPPARQAGALTEVLTGLLRKEPEARLTAQSATPLLRSAARPPEPVPAPRSGSTSGFVPGVTAEGSAHPPTRLAGGPDAPPGAEGPGRRSGTWTIRRSTALIGIGVLVAAGLGTWGVLTWTAGGPPEGWKTYEEYRMALTTAAPSPWKITTEDDLKSYDGPYRGTRYTAPKEDAYLLVDRKEKVTETARATADKWAKDWADDPAPKGGTKAVASVESTTLQGRDAAVLTVEFSKELKDDKGNITGSERWATKSLIVVDSHQERVTLTAAARTTGSGGDAAGTKTAADLLTKARTSFHLTTP